MKNLSRNKKALSPVIATVILIAVTIVVAVSVAYWMGTIASSYTTFEQIEMPTSYPEYDSTLLSEKWTITVQLKNTGSADATITNIYLNEKPVGKYLPVVVVEVGGTPIDFETGDSIIIPKGESKEAVITISDAGTGTAGCDHGVRINIKFHSAGGQDYPLLVKLP